MILQDLRQQNGFWGLIYLSSSWRRRSWKVRTMMPSSSRESSNSQRSLTPHPYIFGVSQREGWILHILYFAVIFHRWGCNECLIDSSSFFSLIFVFFVYFVSTNFIPSKESCKCTTNDSQNRPGYMSMFSPKNYHRKIWLAALWVTNPNSYPGVGPILDAGKQRRVWYSSFALHLL